MYFEPDGYRKVRVVTEYPERLANIQIQAMVLQSGRTRTLGPCCFFHTTALFCQLAALSISLFIGLDSGKGKALVIEVPILFV